MALSGSPIPKVAKPGRVIRSNGTDFNHVSVLPLNAGANQIARITSVADVEDEDTYTGTVTYLDVVLNFSVETDASGTGTELIQLIKDALEAEPLFNTIVQSATIVSNVNLDLVAQDGVTLVVAFSVNPTTDLSATYTDAVVADQFYFGRAVEVTGLTQESGVMIETVEGADSASVTAKFALVLESPDEIYFDVLGAAVSPVGPNIGQAFVVAKPSGSTWYAVEAPVAVPTYGGAVHVEGANTANKGRLLTASSGTTVQWTQAKWIGLDPNYPTVGIIEL